MSILNLCIDSWSQRKVIVCAGWSNVNVPMTWVFLNLSDYRVQSWRQDHLKPAMPAHAPASLLETWIHPLHPTQCRAYREAWVPGCVTFTDILWILKWQWHSGIPYKKCFNTRVLSNGTYNDIPLVLLTLNLTVRKDIDFNL